MKPKKAALSGITNQGMLPLFFHEDADVSIDIVRALYKGGVEILEYTNRGKQALDNFKQIKKVVRKEMPDLLLGAGTIKNVSEAEAFIDAGADFIVSPIVNPEVAHVVSKHKLLWVPGCMTPTEIYLAQKYGADLIKLFPANILGVEFLSSIRDLFPGQLFIPTGGIELTSTSIGSWFKAGVCAVGMGSKLITNEILKNKKYDQLQAQTEKALTLVKAAGGLK